MLTKGKPQQNDESAERLALDVLLWIARDEERLLSFLGATGLSGDAVRAGAGDPAFLAGVLDHVAADEPSLRACARDLGTMPEHLVSAWHKLSPPADIDQE